MLKDLEIKCLEMKVVRIIRIIIIRIKKRHCNNRKDSDGIVGILNNKN